MTNESDVRLNDESVEFVLIGEETLYPNDDVLYLVDENWVDLAVLVDLSEEEDKRHVLQFW